MSRLDGYSEITGSDRRLMDAARAYVAARLANEDAEPCDRLPALIRLDEAWHDLLEAECPSVK